MIEDILTGFQEALGIRELAVTAIRVEGQRVRIEAEVLMQRSCCPICGRIAHEIHQRIPRELRHLPIFGKACLLAYHEYQFLCPDCGQTWIGPLAFVDPYETHTKAYQEYLFDRVKASTITTVAEEEGLPEKTLEHLHRRVAERRLQQRAVPLVRVLGIDEISVKKGRQKYRAVLYDVEQGKVIELLEDREKATVVAFLQKQSRQWLQAIQVVTMDMWEGFYQAVREVLKGVPIVADKFHVVKQLNDRINDTRRAIQREAAEEVREQLKGCRWLLVKPAEKLTPDEQQKLDIALKASPELARCYELKQEFLRIYETKRVRRAKKRLRKWMAKVEAFGQRALLAFVQTLRNWWEEVVAYFRHRVTNAAAEGLNTKIKLVLRRAFGFRNHESFRIRVLQACGGL